MELVEKVVLTREMLLTDIIDKLSIIKRSKILLFLEEGSDIGTSVVTLKLILEKARELQKNLIFITSDPVAQKVINSAGITFYQREQDVKEDDWTDFGDRVDNKDEGQPEMDDSHNVESKENVETDVYAPVAENRGIKVEKESEIRSVSGFSMVVGGDINATQLANSPNDNLGMQEQKVNFEKQSNMSNDKKLIGMDWSKGTANLKDAEADLPDKKDIYVRKGGIKEKFMVNQTGLKAILRHKFIWIGLGVGILLGAIWFFYYYNFVPKVEVTLYPENIPVSYEGTIIAKDSAIGISVDDGVATISSKTGERIVTLSESGNTEEKSEVGEFAKGAVTLYNATNAEINLSAGTVLTGGGKQFKLSEATVIPAQKEEINETISQITKGTKIVAVTASAIGPEYNVSAGTVFSVTGYESAALYGQNFATFTGGTKEEIYIVTEKDVLRIGEKLEKDLEEQLKQQLKDLYPSDKWALIESQIKFEKGTGVERFQIDVPIGSEATIINVTAELKASAVYYNIDELEAAVKELLVLDYNGKISEDGEQGIVNATLDSKFSVNISSVTVTDGTVNINMLADGVMRTSIDIVKTSQELKGMGWEEGLEYLNNLPSMRQDPEVVLMPENYAKKFKHFPNNTSKIVVRIKNESVE